MVVHRITDVDKYGKVLKISEMIRKNICAIAYNTDKTEIGNFYRVFGLKFSPAIKKASSLSELPLYCKLLRYNYSTDIKEYLIKV